MIQQAVVGAEEQRGVLGSPPLFVLGALLLSLFVTPNSSRMSLRILRSVLQMHDTCYIILKLRNNTCLDINLPFFSSRETKMIVLFFVYAVCKAKFTVRRL